MRDPWKVYVVDDDLSFVRSTLRLLDAWDIPAEAATSPAEFLARDLGADPCCVILDLRMPGMSGLDVQRALARGDRKVPVIFVSGHADVQSSVEAMKLGAVDFFIKPVDEAPLIEAVKRAIAQDLRAGVERKRAGQVRELLERLTAEERRVCELVVLGRRDDQIAAELASTEDAVRRIRSRAMEALSVDSVVELVRALDAARLPQS